MRTATRRVLRRFGVGATVAAVVMVVGALPVSAKPRPAHRPPVTSTGGTTAATFSLGIPQTGTVGASGCGSNFAGEPQIRVGYDNNVIMASEDGLGGGTEAWQAIQTGGSGATGCGLAYRGQPNATGGFGASGGDVDIAIGSTKLSSSNQYPVYVSSLNVASVNVASSTDGGQTYRDVPVVEGVPVDDREWIAAIGSTTALLSYHDITTGNIDVLRSDDTGNTFVQEGQAIPSSDYKSGANGIGNIAIDRRVGPNSAAASPSNFFAYQAFVAPSTSSGSSFNEAFLAVSTDGGATWTDNPIGCSTAADGTGLDQQFPQVSVAPNGDLWETWSAGTQDSNGNAATGTIFAAQSADHGKTWSCSGPLSSGVAVMPWLTATVNSSGVEQADLVWYQAPTASGSWSVEFTQNLTGTPTGWSGPLAVDTVHSGPVCLAGATCSNDRQLFDDFGINVDTAGWAHIAYDHDTSGGGNDTRYAVQTSGTQIGLQN